jgi:branched-chain amino acid transport system ATP-binding protein
MNQVSVLRTAAPLQKTASMRDVTPTVPLECSGLSARYGPIQVCFDVSLSAMPGEIVAVLGPNGAGKSSLLGALAGTVSGQGEIKLCGMDLAPLAAHVRAQRGLAYVPEVRGNIFAILSVDENLQLALHSLPRSERAAMKETVFDLFPILKSRISTDAGMLSGGEQQMLAIAMAVSRKPKALLLDEPTQGLAPAIFDILEETFTKLSQSGLPILMAEQNISFGARIAHRYLVLSGGRLVGSGEGHELRNAGIIVERYFPKDLNGTEEAFATV